MSMSILALVLCAAGALAGQPAAPAALDVPFTVWDTAGVERKGEICSSGVPIPCGALKEAEGVAVFDASGKAVPAQFRVLERWREKADGKDDLSVKWLLVTFLADVPAGKSAAYRLKAGQNPAPAAPAKIEEKPDGYAMGGLAFKKDFTAPFKLVLTDADGKERTGEGQDIKWSVWEAGPVRACLKAESPTDHGKFGFIAWVYAYAGQSGSTGLTARRWDLTVALKNTPNDPKGPFYFRDFAVVWEPAELKGAADFALGGEWGKPVAGKLENGTPAYLMQASCGTDKWDKPSDNAICMDWSKEQNMAKAGIGAFRGYKAFTGEKELGAGNFAAGWAALSSGSAGAVASMRQFHHQWPKASEVSAGKVTMRLWPKYAKGFGGLHWLDDCTRKAHDLSFRLGAPLKPEEAEAADKAFNNPLMASVSREWLMAQGFIRPPGGQYPPKPFAGGAAKELGGSGRNWVTWGGDISDRIRRRYHGADMGGFLQTGDPGQANNLLATARHSSGMTPLWIDDYQYPRDVKKLTHAQYCGLARGAGKYREGTGHYGFMTWNDSHFCCQEVFDAWRIWGDPLALDAVTTIGRWCQAWVDFREGGGDLIAGTRADGLPFHNMAEAWRITGEEPMRKSLDRMADVSWKQVNKERGNYGVMGSWEGGNDKVDKPFMMCQVIQGLRAHYEVAASERTLDQITGMLDFILDEATMDPADGYTYGWNYVVKLDEPGKPDRFRAQIMPALEKKTDSAERRKRGGSYQHLAPTFAWAHRWTGDAAYRAVIDSLDPAPYPHRPWNYTLYQPEREDKAAPAEIKDLKAEALGGGKVRLTWTTPADAARVQIKHAGMPLVRRAWPDKTKTSTSWWAADNVASEPAAKAGAQSVEVEGVPAGKRFFAARAWDAAANRSELGNVVEVEVK
ncbi:MAG TPA: hypothetical protein PK280_11080 [Planctomycetota bacterium]|nr:hypothetical protein [Planctomycetota bacterium]